ncbi:MAG TPA: PH domain-containing protein [Micromonosporaceae bacterium]|nr:PH domain-containing protein [Micromonosporaceae bacterium]
MTASGQKARRVARISAVVVVLVFAGLAFTLRGRTDSGDSYFRPEDQIAMILLGFLAAAGVLWFTRPRVVADTHTVRVRNLLGWVEVPWEIVAAVRFDRGHPWASLELRDDDVISIMAVQAADKEYAIAAVRGLRALLAAHREAEKAAGAGAA